MMLPFVYAPFFFFLRQRGNAAIPTHFSFHFILLPDSSASIRKVQTTHITEETDGEKLMYRY